MDYDDYYETICLGIHKINNVVHRAYHLSDKSIYKKLLEDFPAIIIAINCLPMNELEERYQGPITMKCILCKEEGHISAICPNQ